MLPCISLYSNSPNTHTDTYSFRAVEHRGGLTVTGMFRALGRTEKGDEVERGNVSPNTEICFYGRMP